MIRHILLCAALLLAPLLAAPGLAAADGAAPATTREQLVAFVKEGVAHVRTAGREAAFKDFQDDKGAWKRGELYFYVYDQEGVCLAHGAKPALVGKKLIAMQDKRGRKLIQELREAAGKGGGFVEFYWENPASRKVERKLGYAEAVDATCWLGSGIYLGDE